MKKRRPWTAILLAFMVGILTALSGCSAGIPSPAGGKKTEPDPARVYKVGIVQYVDDASLNQIVSNIEEELDLRSDELGVVFDYADYTFNGQADDSTMNQIALELLSDKVDIIIPVATPVAQVMKEATQEKKVPVVFSAVSDPLGAGLVDSLEAPGANVTGVSDALNTEGVLKLILAADPDISRVGLLYDKRQPASVSSIESARKFFEEKGITCLEETGENNEEILAGAKALIKDGAEAVFTPTDSTVMSAELLIYGEFIKAGIPHYAGADSFALNGAFCGYGVDYREAGRETADMAVEVLVNHADPAAMPVITLEGGIATVNAETAQSLGIDYSPFADLCEEVIETTTRQNFDD